MTHVRTRYLLVCVGVSDLTLLAGGIPLQRYSWSLVHANPDVHAIWLALAANVALLLFMLCGFSAMFELARRGAWMLIRRYAAAVALPTLARRTRSLQ